MYNYTQLNIQLPAHVSVKKDYKKENRKSNEDFYKSNMDIIKEIYKRVTKDVHDYNDKQRVLDELGKQHDELMLIVQSTMPYDLGGFYEDDENPLTKEQWEEIMFNANILSAVMKEFLK